MFCFPNRSFLTVSKQNLTTSIRIHFFFAFLLNPSTFSNTIALICARKQQLKDLKDVCSRMTSSCNCPMFSSEFAFGRFINYANICTWMHVHRKQSILWGTITWSEMGKRKGRPNTLLQVASAFAEV